MVCRGRRRYHVEVQGRLKECQKPKCVVNTLEDSSLEADILYASSDRFSHSEITATSYWHEMYRNSEVELVKTDV